MSAKQSRRRAQKGIQHLRALDSSHLSENFVTNFRIQQPYELRPVHKQFLDLIQHDDTNLIFVSGPSGTAKTFLSVLGGLMLLSNKEVEKIVYIRSIVESASKSLGSLPGEVDEKFFPWSLPLYDKLDEIVDPAVKQSLIDNQLIKCLPVNFARGLTFHNSFVIIDEAQNLTEQELITVLTRFGDKTKYVIVGDEAQSDINGRSGFRKIKHKFKDEKYPENGIHTLKFEKTEVVRSKILQLIIEALEVEG